MPILQLSAKDIDGDRTPCTGAQVAAILDLLSKQPEIEAHHWYAGALGIFGSPLVPQYAREPMRIGHFDTFVEQIGLVVQLDDGIIFAMKDEGEPILRHAVFTADGPMHRAVENSFIEMHAFDTSWIELYSDDLVLMRRLANQFPGGKWHD